MNLQVSASDHTATLPPLWGGGGGGDRGAGARGVMGAGGLREAGEAGVGGYLKGAGDGKNGKILQHWQNISQKEKYAEAGAATEGAGNRECRVREAGCSDPPVSPPLPSYLTRE